MIIKRKVKGEIYVGKIGEMMIEKERELKL